MKMKNMSDRKLTTLCYLTKEDKVLFIVKGETKKNISNMNAGKYLGVGGHVEEHESPYECAYREIEEETGIVRKDIKDLFLRGVATFSSFTGDRTLEEIMFIYKGEYTGDRDPCPGSCDEGRLTWVDKGDIYDIPIWEGDREIFRRLFGKEETGAFEIKLTYDKDTLVSVNVRS